MAGSWMPTNPNRESFIEGVTQNQGISAVEGCEMKEIDQRHLENASNIHPSHATEPLPSDAEDRILELARVFSNLTRVSTIGTNATNPFDVKNDPSLDPNSSSFNAAHWLKVYLSVLSQDSDKYPQRTLGVSYRNLFVYGFSGDTDYQKDVLNVFIHSVNLFRELFQEKRKILILREFDGLIRPGEMCVVLGRPGR
jgi:ATP-binding cassette subfamily G (WHITE) protein 2 (PDR)